MVVLFSGQRLAPKGESPLRELVAEASLSELRWPRFQDHQSELAKLYGATDYSPVWIRAGTVTTQALGLIQALENADKKGLEPEDYGGSSWAARLDRWRNGRPPDTEIARFDLALSVSVMQYISDLHSGRVNPKLCHFAFDTERKKLDLAAFVRERLANAADVDKALASVEPPFPGYWRLQRALQRYIALAREDDGEPLPSPRRPVEPGDSYPGCTRLARLLKLLGDLPGDGAPIPDSTVYTGTLVDAVKRFQGRHGLDADGRIGKATLEQLNTPLRRRIRQLQLTLERWRWVPAEFAQPPIVVNIPEFRLRAFSSSYQSELEMNVVVGKAYRTRTPVFANDMRYVIFRPFWNVPPSIQKGELIPQIKRDPAYLAKNDFEIVNSRNEPVSHDRIDEQTLRLLRSGGLAIRQRPGPKNALGLVKFLFPNEYNVYMHDTPATQLFSRSRRDFSHGCIRVQAPEELAVWVLREQPEWTRERIRQAMLGDKTIQVTLRNPIPVLIVYGTAVAPESGEIRFLPDIYGYDDALEQLLAERHSN